MCYTIVGMDSAQEDCTRHGAVCMVGLRPPSAATEGCRLRGSYVLNANRINSLSNGVAYRCWGGELMEMILQQITAERTVANQLAFLATATQETANGRFVDNAGNRMDW